MCAVETDDAVLPRRLRRYHMTLLVCDGSHRFLLTLYDNLSITLLNRTAHSLMDAYTDTSFWDNTPAFTQLPDSDFFALLQKQFPPVADTIPFVGVDPQNLSSYSLPSLTPPSEDSSPSPSISNHEVANDDVNEAPLKRKASEDFSDTPNQKAQHTCKHRHT